MIQIVTPKIQPKLYRFIVACLLKKQNKVNQTIIQVLIKSTI